ncbi:MAG: trigger factor [Muribaculaceae bacterium]|nr:trigger factor [Muribaculaceae bacterium]
MNVNYTQLDNVNGEITITLEEKDYNDKVEKQLKEIAKKRPEPGFRPGKTPMALIRKKYGDAVKYDVINKEVGEKVYDYIREQDLRVLGNPVPVKMDEEFNLSDKDFTFKFKVGVAPEIDTHVNKDLHVPYYTISVSDEMIDKEDKQFRTRFGKQVSGEAVEDNALVKGVLTELDENGQPKEGGIVVENGIVAPSYFKDKAQTALFDGKKVGEEVVFNPAATCEGNENELASMLNIDKAETPAHHGDFKMDIKDIIVVQPAELNEEYFENLFGKDKVHNEEEYRNAIKDMIAASLQNDSFYRFTIDAKDDVLKAVGEIELPEAVLKDYLMQRDEKITPENVDETFASMRPQLVWDLVSEAIARQFGVKVEEDDLLNLAKVTVQQQLAQYGMANAPAEMVEKYAQELLKDQNARQRMAQQSLDFKVFNAIKDNVTLDEKDVTVDEFRALFAPVIDISQAAAASAEE